MTKLTTIFLTGLTALAFTACGSDGGSSGENSGYDQPAYSSEPPLSVNGNPVLVPGYVYSCARGKTFELYIHTYGYVKFVPQGEAEAHFTALDENYNGYRLAHSGSHVFPREDIPFEAGQYYLETSYGCTGDGKFIVQSQVAYNPLAQ